MIDQLKNPKLTKSQAEVYWFSFDPWGWAQFSIHHDSHIFSVTSDWGNASYGWGRNIGPKTFKETLASFHSQYIVDKFSYEAEFLKKKHLDVEPTRKECLKPILKARRDGELDDYEARELYDTMVSTISECTGDPDRFYDVMGSNAWKFYGDPVQYYTRPTPMRLFWEDELIPFFLKHLREEVKSDAAKPAQGI